MFGLALEGRAGREGEGSLREGEGEGEESCMPDICMDRKYLVAACLSCSLSSAVWRLDR